MTSIKCLRSFGGCTGATFIFSLKMHQIRCREFPHFSAYNGDERQKALPSTQSMYQSPPVPVCIAQSRALALTLIPCEFFRLVRFIAFLLGENLINVLHTSTQAMDCDTQHISVANTGQPKHEMYRLRTQANRRKHTMMSRTKKIHPPKTYSATNSCKIKRI